MPLDPTIALKANTPNFYNAVQQGQTDELANQKAQMENQITAEKLPYLPQQLQTEQAKSQLDLQTTKLAQAKAHTQLVAQLLGSSVDQPTYDSAKAQATKLGLDVSDEPTQYDATHVKALTMGALDAAQKIDLAQKQLQMQLNQQKFGLDQQTLQERTRHNTASEAIGRERPLVTYINGAGAFADPSMVARLGGGTSGAPQLPAGTLQPPVATNAPAGTPAGSPSGTATLGAPSFAPNPSATPNPTGIPQGASPVSTLAGDAAPSFYQRSPTQQALIQKVADYDMTPAEAFGRSGGMKSMAMAALAQDFPGYDSKDYQTLVKVKRDYSPGGNMGQQINAINRMGAHLQLYDEMTDALNNGNIQSLNSLVNKAKTEFGDANITNLKQVQDAVGTELAKSLKGAGVVDAQGQQEWQKSFSSSASPAQMKGAADTAVKLVAGQAGALEDGYKAAFKKGILADRINPAVQATLVKHDPAMAKILGAKPASQGAPHPAFQTPQAQDIKAKLQSGAITYQQAAEALKAIK